MDLLFSNITIITMQASQPVLYHAYLGVTSSKICYLSTEAPSDPAKRTIDGKNRLLMPGLINTHSHLPMTILRGYADNCNLQDWLFKHIFPAEAKLNKQAIGIGAALGLAEMLRTGTTSVSDMYFFIPEIAKATLSSGIKANICNGLTSFDSSNFDFQKNSSYLESLEVLRDYHLADHGRIRLDASIHAEYTSHLSAWKAVVNFAQDYNLNMQIHLSETELEHQNCIAKQGKTPAKLFYDCGALDSRATLAHCVWVSDEDIDLLVEKEATVAHNPVSNLKLASGIARVTEMQKRGLNVSLGTDGVSSNNSLDMFEEVKMCSLLQKTITRDASALPAPEALKIATVNGAFAQGRENETGQLTVDFDADIIMLDLSVPNLNPCHQAIDTVVYSASGKDVIMTMVMGKILYENGIYYTIDLEKIYYELENKVLPLLR